MAQVQAQVQAQALDHGDDSWTTAVLGVVVGDEQHSNQSWRLDVDDDESLNQRELASLVEYPPCRSV